MDPNAKDQLRTTFNSNMNLLSKLEGVLQDDLQESQLLFN